MTIDTLYSAFSPVEKYRQFLQMTGAEAPAVFTLSAIDSYLMKRFADSYAEPTTVLDRAGSGSQGQTTVLWAAHPNVNELCVLCNPEQSPLRMLWRSYCARYGIKFPTTPQFQTRFVTHEQKTTSEFTVSNSRVIVNLLHLEGADLSLSEQIEEILNDSPLGNGKPLFLVLGLGKLGQCSALNHLLQFQEYPKGYRFQLARELNPFLASSSLGILYCESDAFMDDIFFTIARQFEGNLDYSSVLRDLIANSLRYDQERKETNEKLSQLRIENQQLQALLSKSNKQEIVEVSIPVPIPIHSPPRPLFFTRVLAQILSPVIPAKLHAALFVKEPLVIRNLKRKYHSSVALVYRIVLRDLRILFIRR